MKKSLWILALVVVLAASCYLVNYYRGEVRATYHSPDGRYTVEVLSYRGFHMGPPGSSGDRPGFVRLLDAKGEVLARKSVEMINLVDEPKWGPFSVDVTVDEWHYPDR